MSNYSESLIEDVKVAEETPPLFHYQNDVNDSNSCVKFQITVKKRLSKWCEQCFGLAKNPLPNGKFNHNNPCDFCGHGSAAMDGWVSTDIQILACSHCLWKLMILVGAQDDYPQSIYPTGREENHVCDCK
jgi:hypothetical protein